MKEARDRKVKCNQAGVSHYLAASPPNRGIIDQLNVVIPDSSRPAAVCFSLAFNSSTSELQPRRERFLSLQLSTTKLRHNAERAIGL
jgi:hypothetical protein